MIERFSHRTIVLILLVMSYLLLMAGNGIVTLTHPDEVFYTQTAKEMLQRGDWLTPYIFDRPQFEKPIFTYWLLMIAIKFFGLTAFAARFWPAAFGIVGVLLTYWFAYVLFERKRTAFLSATVLMSSFIYLALSRAVLTDMIFSIWVVLSLAAFYYGFLHPQKKALSIILCFTFSGIAVLTKGVLGFIFPASVIVGYLLYQNQPKYFSHRATVLGILLFLVIAVPWHWAMMNMYGHAFTEEYFKNVHIRRILEAEHQKSNTWYFYPLTVLTGVFPWSFFLIPAGYACYSLARKRGPHQGNLVFLFFWIGFIVATMQVAQSKLASYIFPVFPAVAILLGFYFDKILSGEDGRGRGVFQAISYGVCGFLFVAAFAMIFFAKRYTDFIVDLKPVYLVSVLFLMLSLVIFWTNRRGKFTVNIGAVFSILLVVLLFVFLGARHAEPWVSCRSICEVLKKTDQSNATVLCSKFYVRAVRFYTDRKTAAMDYNGRGFFSPHPIPFLNREDKILNFLNSQPKTYCILEKDDMHDIERMAGAGGQFAITLLDEIGGQYLLEVKKQ